MILLKKIKLKAEGVIQSPQQIPISPKWIKIDQRIFDE